MDIVERLFHPSKEFGSRSVAEGSLVASGCGRSRIFCGMWRQRELQWGWAGGKTWAQRLLPGRVNSTSVFCQYVVNTYFSEVE